MTCRCHGELGNANLVYLVYNSNDMTHHPPPENKGQDNGAPKRFKQMFQYKCFNGHVAISFFGQFPQFPEIASSLGKGQHQ